MGVHNLINARMNKKDEFYTRYDTIAKEMLYASDVLHGKRILCNCDDPFLSEFVRYFLNNFNTLGLKSLDSSCIDGGNGALHMRITVVPEYMPDIPFDIGRRRKMLDALLMIPGNSLEHLHDGGSFESDECLAILDGCDVVVTNPPFSLARDFLDVVSGHNRNYLFLGNQNLITTANATFLLLNKRLFIGASLHKGDVGFNVPEDYPMYGNKCFRDGSGNNVVHVTSIRWLTSYLYGIGSYAYDFSARYHGHEEIYRFYDNYRAINVPLTKLTPVDYKGIMGVPITFLDRYDPDRFEIVGAATSSSLKRGYSKNVPINDGTKRGMAMIDGKYQYAKLFVVNRHVLE